MSFNDDLRATGPVMDLLPARRGHVLVCGHRGHSVDGHENTRPAFRAAARHGAALCEIDLRQTRDRRLVVFHDDMLDEASTGQGVMARTDYDDLARLRTKPRDRAIAVPGQPIESLEAVVAYCRALGLGLVIEIKDRLPPAACIENLAGLVREAGMSGRVLVSSFDHVVLRDSKRLCPDLRTMGISQHRLAEPAAVARSAAMDMLNTDYPQFTPAIARDLHGAGVGVSHYLPRPGYFALRQRHGVDYHATLRAYLQDGLVDMLVCDDVAWATAFVAGCGLVVEQPFGAPPPA